MSSQKYDPIDLHPDSPLEHPEPPRGHTYPPGVDPMAIPMSNLSASASRYDPERGPGPKPELRHASGSWDMLAGLKKMEHSYEEFDPARNATEPHLAFAEGDLPDNKVSSPRYSLPWAPNRTQLKRRQSYITICSMCQL
jgi:hypothetical protein